MSAAGTRLLFNPQMKSSYNFVPGIMGMIFILICAMMTSVSIVREKETGTMEVLLVSPVRPLKVVLAKMIPYFALSCFNLASILLLARFVLDVPLSGNLGAIIGVSMLYLALSLAFGLLISTFADRQATALIISGMLILLPIIMFSGAGVPDREHAEGVAADLLHHPDPLVHRRRAEADDRGTAVRRRAAGVLDPRGDDRPADRRGAPEVQRQTRITTDRAKRMPSPSRGPFKKRLLETEA